VKALRLRGLRELALDDVEEPDALGPRELLLRNRLCGICGTDLHEYADGPKLVTSDAHPLTGASLPQILGHEFSGEVLAVGAEVRSAAVSDRVSVMPLFFCGECSA
jgi:(R,R)-butanediol dehydrogenase/meso-butanediol dehydrogenase/diacetyl reductase